MSVEKKRKSPARNENFFHVNNDAAASTSNRFDSPDANPTIARRLPAAVHNQHRVECESIYYTALEMLNEVLREAIKEAGGEMTWAAAAEYQRIVAQLKARYLPAPGSVLAMGSNDANELGIRLSGARGKADSQHPLLVKKLQKNDVVNLELNSQNNAAVKQDGTVYTWGVNDHGTLARKTEGDTSDVLESCPTQVTGFCPSQHAVVRNTEADNEDSAIVDAAIGNSITLFLTRNGNVYEAGPFQDQNNTTYRSKRPTDDPRADDDFEPRHVYKLPKKAEQIACGNIQALIVTEDGSLYTYGIATGEYHQDGSSEIYSAIGRDFDKSFFQEGNLKSVDEAHFDLYLTPKLAEWAKGLPHQYKVLNIACGPHHSLVTARMVGSGDSLVYGCGNNKDGQLGFGHTECTTVFTLAESSIGKEIVEVETGEKHSVGLDLEHRRIYTCGNTDGGRLGLFDDDIFKDQNYKLGDKMVPGSELKAVLNWTLVAFPKPNLEFKSIACGASHNLAATTMNEVYTWGFDEQGQLGHGINEDYENFETRPRELDVTQDLEDKHKKNPVIHQVRCGAQHSAILCQLENA